MSHNHLLREHIANNDHFCLLSARLSYNSCCIECWNNQFTRTPVLWAPAERRWHHMGAFMQWRHLFKQPSRWKINVEVDNSLYIKRKDTRTKKGLWPDHREDEKIKTRCYLDPESRCGFWHLVSPWWDPVPVCNPLHRRQTGRTTRPSNVKTQAHKRWADQLWSFFSIIQTNVSDCASPVSWLVLLWRRGRRRRTPDAAEHDRNVSTTTSISKTFVWMYIAMLYCCHRTFMSSLRPKLNLTKNQNNMPANITFRTLLRLPIPA